MILKLHDATSREMTNVEEMAPSSETPRISDDWLAVGCAALLLIVSFVGVWMASDWGDGSEGAGVSVHNPFEAWLSKPGKWTKSPVDSFVTTNDAGEKAYGPLVGSLGVFVTLSVLLTLAVQYRDGHGLTFLKGFAVVFVLATVAYALAAQSVVKAYNLEYALWALLVGLIISNTIGTPAFVKPAVRTEFLIKTGLVLLGAEVVVEAGLGDAQARRELAQRGPGVALVGEQLQGRLEDLGATRGCGICAGLGHRTRRRQGWAWK